MPVGPRFSGHLIVQPRFDEGISQLQRVVLRPWVQATLGRGFAGALGYDAHVIVNPDSTLEQRVWQQLAWGHAWQPLRGFARVRLEERFLEGPGGTAWRTRVLVGLGRPLGRGLELVAQDELFVNLNETRQVTQRGLSENRACLGVGRPFGERLRADLGYQMQRQQRSGPDRILHTLMLGLRFDAPGLA